MAKRAAKQETQNNISALLTSFERHLRAQNRATGTIENYRRGVLAFTEWAQSEDHRDPATADRETVERWLETLYASLAPATVKTRYMGLRLFFDWLVREEEIPATPFGPKGQRRIEPPELPETPKDIVPAERIDALLRSLERQRRWRDVVIIAVLYDTGMRSSELAECLSVNVDLEAGRIFIPVTKAKRIRVVPLSAPTCAYIDRYWRRWKGEGDKPRWLVMGARGQMTRSGIYQVVRALFAEAGMDAHIGGHDLRHTSATHQTLSGLSESGLMTLMGWRSRKMAERYTEQGRVEAALQEHRRASPVAALHDARKGKRP